jgi:hypothetical protein
MDFIALVNFCNSSLISRNSFAMFSAVSSFMLYLSPASSEPGFKPTGIAKGRAAPLGLVYMAGISLAAELNQQHDSWNYPPLVIRDFQMTRSRQAMHRRTIACLWIMPSMDVR